MRSEGGVVGERGGVRVEGCAWKKRKKGGGGEEEEEEEEKEE